MPAAAILSVGAKRLLAVCACVSISAGALGRSAGASRTDLSVTLDRAGTRAASAASEESIGNAEEREKNEKARCVCVHVYKSASSGEEKKW